METIEQLTKKTRPELRRIARDLQISGWPSLTDEQLVVNIYEKRKKEENVVEQIVTADYEKEQQKEVIIENKETKKVKIEKPKQNLTLKKDKNDPNPFRSSMRRFIFEALKIEQTKANLKDSLIKKFVNHNIKDIDRYISFTIELLRYKYGFVIKRNKKAYKIILPEIK